MGGSETDPEDDETPLEAIVTGIVTTLTLLVAFGLLSIGQPFFWVAFVVGFAGVLPTALGLVRYYQREGDAADDGDAAEQMDAEHALEELRERYARGELSEAEFERRLETLLETESVGDARDYAAGERDGGADDERAEGPAADRNREPEFELE